MSNYNPSQIEPKWQKVWEERGIYKAVDFDSKPKYYALSEFPYPSGEGLHMGHVFNYGTPDIFARKKRMEGLNVLFPMGWDAFGLPTENYAVKTGIQPAVVTKNNTDRFRAQMKALAFSFDWAREINTTDPNYFKWTQWIFLQLFKHGLAYKSETPVGWCPSCKIVLANEEIINGKCERCGTTAQQRRQSQWVLRITSYADRLDRELDLVDYPEMVKTSQRNWIGRKEGVKIKFDDIEVFTTRPDTIYGATFIVLAPDHPLARLVSEAKRASKVKTVVNPATGKEIPVFVDEYVVAGVGTGAIMGVPAHDGRDFEFAKKHNLPIVRVVKGPDRNDRPIEQLPQVFDGEGVLINSGPYNGLKSTIAFEKIVKDLEKRGLAAKMVSYHLRDWIFSRQHYWGEPIPMVYCGKCAKDGVTWWESTLAKDFKPLFNPKTPEHFDALESPVDLAGWFPLQEEDLPLTLPEVDKYQPTVTGESPLANINSWVATKCPNCAGPARRETDTMPNWAGSSWYYLRFADPASKNALGDMEKLNYWTPVDVYFGGAEHTTLHVLYSRFWHKFLNDIGAALQSEPYRARRQHGLILAEDGSKMSKSKGNVVNPDDIVAKYGADAVRTFLAFVGPYEQTLPWSTAGVEGVRRFFNRVWQSYLDQTKIAKMTSPLLAAKLNWAIGRVTVGIDQLKQNTGVAALMELLNDWERGGSLSKTDAEKFLKLLAPFAPHLAEELWHRLGKGDSIHLQAWPKVKRETIISQTSTIIISIDGKKRASLEISKEGERALGEKGIAAMAQKEETVAKYLAGKEIKRVVYRPGKVINFVTGKR